MENFNFALFALEGTANKELFRKEFSPEEWAVEYKDKGRLVRTVNRITKMEVYSHIQTFRVELNGLTRDFKAGRFAVEIKKLVENGIEASSPGASASPVTFAKDVRFAVDELTANNDVSIFEVINEAEICLKNTKKLKSYGDKITKLLNSETV